MREPRYDPICSLRRIVTSHQRRMILKRRTTETMRMQGATKTGSSKYPLECTNGITSWCRFCGLLVIVAREVPVYRYKGFLTHRSLSYSNDEYIEQGFN